MQQRHDDDLYDADEEISSVEDGIERITSREWYYGLGCERTHFVPLPLNWSWRLLCWLKHL